MWARAVGSWNGESMVQILNNDKLITNSNTADGIPADNMSDRETNDDSANTF